MMDGTDADGEWSDEEVLRSGSQTGVSENDQDDVQPNYSTKLKRPRVHYSTTNGYTTSTTPTITVNHVMSMEGLEQSGATLRTDPVSMILDRIDAELDEMDKKESKLSSQLPKTDKVHSKPHRPGSSRQKQSLFGKQEPALNGSADTGLGTGSLRDSDISDVDKDQKITGSAEIYSEAAMTDDDRGRKMDSDIPSDLDSVAAQQIDQKFKEIMRKKKEDEKEEIPLPRSRLQRRNSTGSGTGKSQQRVTIKHQRVKFAGSKTMPPDLPAHPGKPLGSLTNRLRTRSATRPSATMLSTGYGTDNDSVKTEDFESKFMGMIVPMSDSERQETSLKTTAVTSAQGNTTNPSTTSLAPPQTNTETPGLSPQDTRDH